MTKHIINDARTGRGAPEPAADAPLRDLILDLLENGLDDEEFFSAYQAYRGSHPAVDVLVRTAELSPDEIAVLAPQGEFDPKDRYCLKTVIHCGHAVLQSFDSRRDVSPDLPTGAMADYVSESGDCLDCEPIRRLLQGRG